MSYIGSKIPVQSPARERPLIQYIPEVKGNYLNVRVGLNNGHPTKSLRYSLGNVRSPAEVAIPWLHLEVRNAATSVVLALQSVFTL